MIKLATAGLFAIIVLGATSADAKGGGHSGGPPTLIRTFPIGQ
jgi:hypothetical protein